MKKTKKNISIKNISIKNKIKNKKYNNQKGGDEHMSNMNTDIVKREKEKKKKQNLLKTLIKLIYGKHQQNKKTQK